MDAMTRGATIKSEPLPLCVLEPVVRAVALLDTARRSLASGSDAANATIAEACLLLRDVVTKRSFDRPALKGGTLSQWQRSRVFEYIDEHIGLNLRVSDLGGVVKLSTAHFSRLFKRSFGRGPRAYIMQRRIESALALMRKSTLSLCDIAIECGFADQSHFCRAFRQNIGVNPSTWRHQHADYSH